MHHFIPSSVSFISFLISYIYSSSFFLNFIPSSISTLNFLTSFINSISKMENTIITPGPINNDLLFLKSEHRAYQLFHNQQLNDNALNVRRADQKFWRLIKNHPIPVRVMNYIRTAGFEGVFKCGYKFIDHGLITALVERWRPETNTFHLPIGEVTVTLQDVEVMWGLPINGDPVTGKEQKWSNENLHDKCLQLLGFPTSPSYFRSGQLKTKYLYELLESALPENASDHQCIQRARAYILFLLGGVLFPDTSDSYVHMNLLVLLEDFDRCSRFSWGSAVLACLYRNLYKASIAGATEIAGPLMLLQLWAWCRIPCTSPTLPNYSINGKIGRAHV